MSTQSALHGKDPRDILIAPVVSEKSYSLLDQGKYTFIVDPRANKTEIKIAIERIFDVFFTMREGGTGLGLAVSRSIIERHSGKISLQSEPGKGTTVTTTLPVPGSPAHAAEPALAGAETKTR